MRLWLGWPLLSLEVAQSQRNYSNWLISLGFSVASLRIGWTDTLDILSQKVSDVILKLLRAIILATSGYGFLRVSGTTGNKFEDRIAKSLEKLISVETMYKRYFEISDAELRIVSYPKPAN